MDSIRLSRDHGPWYPCGWTLDTERKEDEDAGGEEEEMRHIVAAAWGPALRAELSELRMELRMGCVSLSLTTQGSLYSAPQVSCQPQAELQPQL